MNINRRQKNNAKKIKVVALIALVTVLSALAAFIYFRQENPSGSQQINLDPPTVDQKKAGEAAKKEAIDRSDSGTDNSSESPTSPTNPISFTLAQDSEKGLLNVSTVLSNSLSWNKCYLKLTQGQTVRSFEARTVYQPTNSFCGGFSIPTDNLSGTWLVSLRADDLNGKLYEKSESIEIR